MHANYHYLLKAAETSAFIRPFFIKRLKQWIICGGGLGAMGVELLRSTVFADVVKGIHRDLLKV